MLAERPGTAGNAMLICPNCGEENPDRFRLCGFCGTTLVSEQLTDKVRKTVTILFCDLKGSTPLGEKLDPESLREVLALYFDEMSGVLERHGGKVEKYIGDAIVAVFGLPRAHEDDALRACRAALDMERALERINETIEARWDVRLENRTGVNTGEVIAGEASASQHLVTGDAVNTAARLEQNAPTDQVLIGDPTYRLVRDAVEVEIVEPLELKGKAERVPAYRLVAVHSDEAIARNLDSPMVGRTKELGVLNDAFDRTTTQSAAHLVTVFGPPGAGKSRLLREFLNRVRDDVTTVHGRCLSYGEGITFWPLADIVRTIAGITDDDNLEAARAKLDASIEDVEVAERVAAAVGLSDAPFSVNETYWAAARFFAQLACKKPLVAVIDDIHWAEQAFLDLLRSAMRSLQTVPVLFLCSSRPELLEAHSDWGNGEREYDVVLKALTAEESASVIENILGSGEIDGRARARIIQAAEGNPLFVEQMVSMLVEDGIIERDASGAWRLIRDLDSLAMPGSINALITARLDRLTAGEQSVLQRAALIGQQFFRDAVEHLLSPETRPTIDQTLESLVFKGLIVRNQVSVAGLETFRFVHILIRDAAYAGMLKRARAELHEAFVDWVEGANPDRVREFEEIRGYHLEQSFLILGDLGPLNDHGVSLGLRASKHLAAAGKRAVARADMHAAANLLRRAAVLVPLTDPVGPRLHLDAAEALFEVGDFSSADESLVASIDGATACGDQTLATTASLVRRQFHFMTEAEGQEDELIAEATRGIEILGAADDHSGLVRAWRLLYYVHGTVCRYAAAENAAEQTMEHARIAGDTVMEKRFLYGLVICAVYGPTTVPDLIARCEQVLDRAGDDRKTRALTVSALARAEAMRGDFSRVRELYTSSRATLEDLGWNLHAALISHNSGPIEMMAGDLETAEAELRRDYEALEKMGERNYRSTTAGWLAEVLYRSGRDEEALTFTDACEEIAAPDDVTSQFLWRTVRAKLLARKGMAEAAESLGREACRIIERSDDIDSQGQALMDLSGVLELAGKRADAIAAIQHALTLFTGKGDVVATREARARLSALEGNGHASPAADELAIVIDLDKTRHPLTT